MLETLQLIGYITLAVIIVIGLIRVMTLPYQGFFNLLLEMFLIDCLIDFFVAVCENISNLLED